ncbi:MAG: FkbM family methyltransferase [Pseudomonadota bacterium]|nr:FkbM family methyltransferase [Pseudomonadota bacterium]
MIKNFKEKYIKNLFFYHIYRYFKYKFKYFKSYGATGEDVLLNKIFKNNLSGFYLDIGSLHPINGSLTYNLYQKGWNGINIDLLESNLRLFKIFRSRDLSKKIAVSSKAGFIDSFIFGSGSGLNTVEKKWADRWSKIINKKYVVKKIKRKTLNQIIQEYKISKNIELLNIDVEGHEIDVLNGINFDLFRPKIITIEIHVNFTNEIFKNQSYKILKKNRYELISHYYHTSFFKAKEFKINDL